jgi:hypothetical protein
MSLLDAKWDDVREEIRNILIDLARQRQTITYSELAALVQSARLHYHSHIFFQLLIDVGRIEADAGRPILPALVVTKQTGMPGGGYFTLSENVDSGDLRAEWENDLHEVYVYWGEH